MTAPYTAAELAAIRAATSHLTDAEFREKYTPLLAHFERWRGRLNRSFGLDEMGSMEPAITHADRLVAELTRACEDLRAMEDERDNPVILLAKNRARQAIRAEEREREPATVQELRAEIDRLTSKLAHKVLGDPRQSVGARASSSATQPEPAKEASDAARATLLPGDAP